MFQSYGKLGAPPPPPLPSTLQIFPLKGNFFELTTFLCEAGGQAEVLAVLPHKDVLSLLQVYLLEVYAVLGGVDKVPGNGFINKTRI